MKNAKLKEAEIEARAQKARAMIWSKPLHKMLNLYDIRERLQEILEDCAAVHWATDNSGEQSAVDALTELLGDEDQAYQVLTQFDSLETDAEEMLNDVEELREYLSNDDDEDYCTPYEDLMVCCGRDDEVMGFDIMEHDYIGLDNYQARYASEKAAERLKRLTKDELISEMQKAFMVVVSFEGVDRRFVFLKNVFDLMSEKYGEELRVAEKIDKLWRELDADNFYEYSNTMREFETLLRNVPDMTWLQ